MPLPALTPIAQTRFTAEIDFSFCLPPVSLVSWDSPLAKSVQPSDNWLNENFQVILGLVTALLLGSHRDLLTLKIGIFCPWVCIVDFLITKFQLAPWAKHAKYWQYQSPRERIAEALQMDPSLVEPCHVLLALKVNPGILAAYLRINTSISSASTTVNHSIALIPKHTRFTGQWMQALVSVTRSLGTLVVVAPKRARFGFFRYLIPAAIKAFGCLAVDYDCSFGGLLANLASARANSGSTNKLWNQLSLYKPLSFEQVPLAISVRFIPVDAQGTVLSFLVPANSTLPVAGRLPHKAR